MAGDWRISADERTKYESYFQQCNPTQGYLTGEQARSFFVKSTLSGEILRRIWDLSDITKDGRLDKREFAIACHLISLQVQNKGPLPAALPATLLADAISITTNGVLPMAPLPLTITPSGQPVLPGNLLKPAVIPPAPLTPTIRSKYLQQFHSLVDVTKTNGFMTGLQAKNLFQQTGLSQTLLHQIWTFADNDKDGRLTPDEFVVAMHCCDISRTGQTLPARLPDEWLHANIIQRERTGSIPISNMSQAFANLNQDFTDAFTTPNPMESYSDESVETERRNSLVTYEEKRQKNYQDGYKELERRRQLLREQEEREHRERDERERKREYDIQKQKDDVERKKQMDFERQLERQRQIEQQKDEERRKLFDQRETARKEMERKSRLEWERQRMQELSTQKSRLLDQINDLKSREKALGLEIQSMDDTIETNQRKINQTNSTIQTIDQSILDIQKRSMQEKNLLENIEQQRKDFIIKLNNVQRERESLSSSFKNLNQSKEFSSGNRESEQMRFIQAQIETMKQEGTRTDEQVITITNQCKQYQNQMEQLRSKLSQLEQDAKTKKLSSQVISPVAFPVYDQFYANTSSNDFKTQSSAIDDDPFQKVDPFASQSDIGSPIANNDWFQPSNNRTPQTDPFQSKLESTQLSPRTKKTAPKPNIKQPAAAAAVDPWGGSTAATNNGNTWTPFNTTTVSNGNSSSGIVQYQALYDYTPERPDEMAMTTGDIISIDPTQQQDENWLFGKIGNNKQGFFPAAYAERTTSTPVTPSSGNGSFTDTTSHLASGSWAMTLADYQGKTVDKHLTFKKNELILVREQKDTTWYSGQLGGKVGWFPRNYVRPATQIEIQNNKNSTKNTPNSEKPPNSPLSSNGVSSNDSTVVWRQAPTIPTIPDVYEAIYPYEASESTDLSFNVGERIIVLKRDGDWWTGKIDDRTGTFPNNYVQKIDNPLQETAVSIASFQANEDGRLSFDQGQLIYIRKKGDKGWYQGEIRTSDQPIRVGWFPANCVQLQGPISPTSPGTSYQNTSKFPRYIAVFPYEAQQDDELSFPADAVLEILDQTGNSGWLKARLGNQTGLIPSTYVQPIDEHNPFPSPQCRLISCTPTTPNSSQRLSNNNNSTIITISSDNDTSSSSQSLPTNSSRISAIRELIETEQRYVDDLLTVSNQFIKPLNNARVINDNEIEQFFINWYSLIDLNSCLLRALHEQVNYKEQISSPDNQVMTRTPRSVSMSNIALAAQMPVKNVINDRHRSFTPDVSHSPSVLRLKHRSGTHHHHRSPSSNALTATQPKSIEHLNDHIIPQISRPSSGSITVTDSTKVGAILCSHLPTMANAYFQYCNYRSQANKILLLKIESNEQFRSYLKVFQDYTGGLSLNGFLTKPIQRVTRYPLLIEKIVKHTSLNHLDYSSIKQALECARQLNERINKQISEQESSLRLDWLQQHLIFGSDENSSDGYLFDELFKFNSINKYNLQRQLLLHGVVMKVPSGKELLAFLFNDFVLFSTVKTSSSNWQTQLFEQKSNLQLKLYRMPLFLTDIIIANDALNDQLTFSITTKIYEKPLLLKTQQTNVRTLWVKAINNAVEECQAAEKSILADKALFVVTDTRRDSKTAVARLLLVVQEAHDLMPSNTTLERHRSVDPYCEITVGSLTLKTPFIKRSIKPKWNAPMQFLLYNLVEDIIHINICDHEFFSPNQNLGHTSIHLVDILPCPLDTFITKPSLPFTQTLFLNNGSSIVIKFVVQLLLPHQ